MRTISVNRTIPATREQVWAVLADFGNIATWNAGVKASYLTGTEAEGVGAKRHCDLAPLGELEETVSEWLPNERMVVDIDSAKKIPVDHGQVTFSLLHGGERSTKVDLSYAYQPGFGPLGSLIGSFIDKQLIAGFTGFLEDLEAAALAIPESSS